MPKHTLYDNFEYKGLWWLPERPENKIAGIISFDGERITLELLGLLREDTGSRSREWFHPDLILGIAEGKYITLYLTLERHSTIPWGDAASAIARGILHNSAYGV